jgi:hypothetical protein
MVLQGMRQVFRPLLVVGLVIALAGAAWAECASGELTPAQQACCATMGHNCGAAGREMGCCPTDQQTQERVLAVAAKRLVSAPALLKGPLAVVPSPHLSLDTTAGQSFDRERLKLPDRPGHLVLSVLLI